jgi:hypothetical protein
MIFVGIILVVIAAVCFFMARGQASRLQAMNAADTYTAQLLTDLHKRVTSSLGAEALAQQCELEGVIECDAPLTAPLSGTACVAYTRSVTRDYEEDVTTTNEGKTETHTERRSETLESEDRRVNFWVRDATGRALVNPDQAELDLVETADRYEPAASPGRGRTRTLGHRYVEHTLTPGTQVYVLGCAVDCQGQPIVARNPRDSKGKFLVSRRSERELAQSAAAASRNFYYAAAGSGVAGILLLAIGLLNR